MVLSLSLSIFEVKGSWFRPKKLKMLHLTAFHPNQLWPLKKPVYWSNKASKKMKVNENEYNRCFRKSLCLIGCSFYVPCKKIIMMRTATPTNYNHFITGHPISKEVLFNQNLFASQAS